MSGEPYINPQAFSEDGFIIDQRYTEGVPYGSRKSSYSGCGWIAAYNFLHAMGRDVSWSYISAALGARGLFRGHLGTGPFRLYRYLRRQKFVALRRGYGVRGVILLSQRPLSAGVLLYRHSKGMHYVAFKDAGNGQYRYFNAVPGHPQHVESMEEFLSKRAKKWPVMVMGL